MKTIGCLLVHMHHKSNKIMLRAIRHHLKRKKSNHPFTVCCNKNSNVTLNKIRFGRITKLDYLYILELKFVVLDNCP